MIEKVINARRNSPYAKWKGRQAAPKDIRRLMCTVELQQQVWEVLLCVKALLVLLYDIREKSCKNPSVFPIC